MAYFSVENIYKSFGKAQILKGISFDMEKGDVVSVLGSSGSGKTTLLRCINFLEIADSGKIMLDGDVLFDGTKIKDKDIRQRRLQLGLVFQNFNLFPQYTLLENVTLAPKLIASENAKLQKLSKENLQKSFAEIEENARTIIQKVGLKDKMELYPSQLSGGQQQRVAIARALAQSPKVLCFDEPTSALDPELTGEVLKVIKELKSTNMTMIIVTHEMEFAKNISDKVVFMSDGVIAEEGSSEQIFNNPKNPVTQAFLKNYLKTNQ